MNLEKDLSKAFFSMYDLQKGIYKHFVDFSLNTLKTDSKGPNQLIIKAGKLALLEQLCQQSLHGGQKISYFDDDYEKKSLLEAIKTEIIKVNGELESLVGNLEKRNLRESLLIEGSAERRQIVDVLASKSETNSPMLSNIVKGDALIRCQEQMLKDKLTLQLSERTRVRDEMQGQVIKLGMEKDEAEGRLINEKFNLVTAGDAIAKTIKAFSLEHYFINNLENIYNVNFYSNQTERLLRARDENNEITNAKLNRLNEIQADLNRLNIDNRPIDNILNEITDRINKHPLFIEWKEGKNILGGLFDYLLGDVDAEVIDEDFIEEFRGKPGFDGLRDLIEQRDIAKGYSGLEEERETLKVEIEAASTVMATKQQDIAAFTELHHKVVSFLEIQESYKTSRIEFEKKKEAHSHLREEWSGLDSEWHQLNGQLSSLT